jgi:NAD(P)H-dependent FMN reductase
MPDKPTILAFAGSARKGSWNKQLLAAVVEEARAAGAEVTHLDLADFPMPLYNGDIQDESGLPESAAKLVALIQAHQALLVASPEYNSQTTPLFKNTIDWCSVGDVNPFTGKVAAVVSASPGPFGGVRSALLARSLLMKLGCHVIPAQCTLSRAHEAFDENRRLKNPRSLETAREVAAQLVRTTAKLNAAP